MNPAHWQYHVRRGLEEECAAIRAACAAAGQRHRELATLHPAAAAGDAPTEQFGSPHQTYRFELPRKTRQWSLIRSSVERPLQGRKILVVEDEYFLASECSEWLAEAGAEIVGAVPSVAEANNVLDNNRVDAVLLDLNLRGVLAYDLARRLQRDGVPIVFATGYGRDMLPADQKDALLLEKPFRSRDLIAAIGSMIEQSASQAPERDARKYLIAQ